MTTPPPAEPTVAEYLANAMTMLHIPWHEAPKLTVETLRALWQCRQQHERALADAVEAARGGTDGDGFRDE